MALPTIDENSSNFQYQRRHSWPLTEQSLPNNSDKQSNSCQLTKNQRRILHDFRRLSQVVQSIPKQDSFRTTYQLVTNTIVIFAQFLMKWVMMFASYIWNVICIDYATVSERADLEGNSSMESSLATSLKRVRYENYRIRLGDDLYGNIVRMPWSYIFTTIAIAYLAVAILFTFAYVVADLIDLDLSYSFWHWLVFSLSTTTCLGSDSLDSEHVHLIILLIANTQAFISQLMLAFVTGIVFARFSRGQSQINFATKLTINQVDGADCLQGRLTPYRPRFGVLDCNIKMYVARPYTTKEGEQGVRTIQVPLLTETLPAMAVMLKFTHQLDESSEIRKAMELGENFTVVTTISGADACTLNSVFGVKRYTVNDIMRNHQFVDMITKINPEADEPLVDTQLKVDFNKLNKLTPVRKIEAVNKNKKD